MDLWLAFLYGFLGGVLGSSPMILIAMLSGRDRHG